MGPREEGGERGLTPFFHARGGRFSSDRPPFFRPAPLFFRPARVSRSPRARIGPPLAPRAPQTALRAPRSGRMGKFPPAPRIALPGAFCGLLGASWGETAPARCPRHARLASRPASLCARPFSCQGGAFFQRLRPFSPIFLVFCLISGQFWANGSPHWDRDDLGGHDESACRGGAGVTPERVSHQDAQLIKWSRRAPSERV